MMLMRALICTWIVCVSVACARVALAAPSADVGAKHKLAVSLNNNGEFDKALAAIEEGLAIAPKDLPLLGLKGTVLLTLRDYLGALAAYQAYVDAGAKGASRRAALKIINDLEAAKSTFLEVTLGNGTAPIYLDSKTQGVFCTAAPSCHKAMLPGDNKVIAERPGFERWTGNVTIVKGQTTKLAVTLVEKPSLLTVRVAPPGARIMVDDAAYDAPTTVAAGKHQVVVSLPGHVEARLEATAHEGKPVELDVALTQLVAVRVEPPGAELLLDDKPVAIQGGSIAVAPGPHVLVARAKGFIDRRIQISAARAPDYQLAIELARPAPEPPLFTSRRKIALAAGGVGLLAASAGIVLGVQSGRLDDDTYALCPSPASPCPDAPEANDLNQRARSRALQANIAYGVASGAAIAAAVLWFTGAPGAGAPESRIAVTPQLGAVAGLDVAVRF
jgi:tetratricopeptide (TPR) repeat protein